jgi:outer membrane protein OmpU
MNNFKKIGLSALAGSLVATSAFAGEVSVSGGASLNVEHTSGGAGYSGKTFSMGNQLTFTGGGELDNGLNVSISFVLDQNDDATSAYTTKSDNAGTPFDSHSVTISSDSLGTLVFSGEGGNSAQTAVDTTAAGDIWDNFDISGTIKPGASATSDNSFLYTLPAIMDGVAIQASYVPTGTGTKSATAWNVTYTGIEGLTAQFANGEGSSPALDIDVTTYKFNYAYGPVTIGYSNTDYDHATATEDQEISSWKVSYTVSDELSVTYGTETVEDDGTAMIEDFETASLSASYTAGGMTISAAMQTADNMNGTTTATQDRERWALSASFAF